MIRRLALALCLLAALASASVAQADTTTRLQELGAQRCTSRFVLYCVPLTVPLDHFANAETPTQRLYFAVHPAEGHARGTLVIADGGPGVSGIGDADRLLDRLPAAVRARYDIVFQDQRGVGLSSDLQCPIATTLWANASAWSIWSAGTMSRLCPLETNAGRLLPLVSTAQSVEDLEAFRVALGSPRLVFYGESYGTTFAQVYAARHPTAVTAMILDGTEDPTLSGDGFATGTARAFEEVLDTTLRICDRRPACHADLPMGAGAAYDALAARLEQGPIAARVPTATGQVVTRALTIEMLQRMTMHLMYGAAGRSYFLKVLASAARGDIAPVLIAALTAAGVDIGTQTVQSSATFLAYQCHDRRYWADWATAAVDDASAMYETRPRLAPSIMLSYLPCIGWPGSAQAGFDTAFGPLPHVSTIVLTATADPATPYDQALSTATRLGNVHLVVTQGGDHVTYRRSSACVDRVVDALLLDGRFHPGRTDCPGEYVGRYPPN